MLDSTLRAAIGRGISGLCACTRKAPEANVETSANKVDTDFTKQENMFNIFFISNTLK